VILYQEQVLQAAIAVAGFTEGQAEALRRAMSRKRSRENMERFYELFRDGAVARGVSEDVARTVFEKIIAFAEFGFPKSHAAAFAVLAYQSAWLRRYYTTEFTCALLNAQPMGFYPPHTLIHDAKRHGVTVLPPDINASGAACTVEEGALRIGFSYVQSIGETTAQAIARERNAHGRFRSLSDFVRRTNVLMAEPSLHGDEVGSLRLEAGSVERGDCHPERGDCHPEQSDCHPEQAQRREGSTHTQLDQPPTAHTHTKAAPLCACGEGRRGEIIPKRREVSHTQLTPPQSAHTHTKAAPLQEYGEGRAEGGGEVPPSPSSIHHQQSPTHRRPSPHSPTTAPSRPPNHHRPYPAQSPHRPHHRPASSAAR
jgi:hypothetical protein